MSRPKSTSSVCPPTPQNTRKHRRNLVLFRHNTCSAFDVNFTTDSRKPTSQEHHPCINTSGSSQKCRGSTKKSEDQEKGYTNYSILSKNKSRDNSLSGLSLSCEDISRDKQSQVSTAKCDELPRELGLESHGYEGVNRDTGSSNPRVEGTIGNQNNGNIDVAKSNQMKRIRENQRFRKTIDNSDCQFSTSGVDNVSCTYPSPKLQRIKRDCKSLSMESSYGIPEGVNPMFFHCGEDREGMKVSLTGCVLDESSTDPQWLADDSYDIAGTSSMYPWQREVGIQCDMISQSSQEDLPEVFDKVQSPQVRQRSKARGTIRQCLSLDTGQKYQDDPTVLHHHILEAIKERENAKRRVHSSSDAEVECRAKVSSKTYSASTSKSPSSILKNARSGSGGDIQTSQWPSRPRVYGSTSNLNLDHQKVDVLPSPPLSPRDWVKSNVRPENTSRTRENIGNTGNKPMRRKSSDSVSNEEESDTEPSPTMVRQGRRKAIFDSRAVGVITAPDGDQSPTNSCDESDSSAFSSQNDKSQSSQGSGEKKFHDDISTVRRKKVLIKRNTVHDFASNKSYQSVFSEHDAKKNKSSFSIMMKLMDKKGHKGKDSLAELPDVLQALKPTEFKDQNLISYKSLHWSELIASKEKEKDVLMVTEVEVKRREAVWELFKSECVFLVDHLMVLKHCFMEPMKKVQVEGHLMFAEPQDLFGNLDELCYVSYTFCKDFITLLLSDARVCDFGRTQVLVKALQRLSQLSRDGEVYHDYCLNYSKAVNYLEILRKNDKFCEFERWCENDPRCHRLQLADLLISPMQHCTKVPLLLFNIRKYTEDPDERQQLTHSLEKLEKSLKKLEAKMDWLKNYERVQEIQQQIQWQPVTELDPRAFIPEFLKPTLTRQPCEKLLTSPKRQLLHEGPVTLLEISKALDMYMFLFDDILLLTKFKKQPRKKSDGDRNPLGQRAHTDGAVFVVHKQPIALDRFTIHDVKTPENAIFNTFEPGCPLNCTSARAISISIQGDGYQPLLNASMEEDEQGLGHLLFGCVPVANGLRHAFVLVQISRFQQVIGVYTLQAHSEVAKETWMTKLTEAQKKYKNCNPSKKWLTHAGSLLVSCEETIENNVVEKCLTTFLEKKERSNSNCDQSNHHEPIIGTPKAFPGGMRMKDEYEESLTATNHSIDDQSTNLSVNELDTPVAGSFVNAFRNEQIPDSHAPQSQQLELDKTGNNIPGTFNKETLSHTTTNCSDRPLTTMCFRSSQEKHTVNDIQEHGTQTDGFQKRRPRFERQQTTIGQCTKKRPTSLCFDGQNEEPFQRISHLVSPTKLRTIKCNGSMVNGKNGTNERNKVSDTDARDTLSKISLDVIPPKQSERVKDKYPGPSQWDGSSPDDTGEVSGEQDKSPLLGKHQVDSNSERIKEIQKIRKLTRLKAIQEKNQSVDVIYI